MKTPDVLDQPELVAWLTEKSGYGREFWECDCGCYNQPPSTRCHGCGSLRQLWMIWGLKDRATVTEWINIWTMFTVLEWDDDGIKGATITPLRGASG